MNRVIRWVCIILMSCWGYVMGIVHDYRTGLKKIRYLDRWSLVEYGRYDTHPRVFSSDEKVRATASWPPSFLGKRVHRPRSLVWSILVTYSEYRQVDCERCRFIPGNEKRIFFPSFYSGLSILFFFFSFFFRRW